MINIKITILIMPSPFAEAEAAKVQYFDKLKEEYENSDLYEDEIPSVTLEYHVKEHEVVDHSVENDDTERKSYAEFATEGIPEDSSVLHPAEYPVK